MRLIFEVTEKKHSGQLATAQGRGSVAVDTVVLTPVDTPTAADGENDNTSLWPAMPDGELRLAHAVAGALSSLVLGDRVEITLHSMTNDARAAKPGS